MLLVANIVPSVFVSLRKAQNYAVAVPRSAAVAIMAVLLGELVRSLPEGPTLLPTAVAAIAVEALVVGVFFLMLGWLKMGKIIRYMPYAVVNGFVAGIGVQLVIRALSLSTGAAVSVYYLTPLFRAGTFLQWVLAVSYGFLLFFAGKRWKHSAIIPGILAATVILVLMVMRMAGIDHAEALANGWFLGPFDDDLKLWPPLHAADFAHVEWSLLLKQSGLFVLIALVSVLDLLMVIVVNEGVTKQDIDLDQSLRVHGVANLLSSFAGGSLAYESVPIAAIPFKLRAPGRVPSLVNALLTIVVLSRGMEVLSIVPRFMLGGLVVSLGLGMLTGPLFGGLRKLPRVDYCLLCLVTVIVVFFGFAQGAICGVMISLGIFVVAYSRQNVIRLSGTGASIRSSVSRSPASEEWLARDGGCIRILRLQGHIFFATSHGVITQVRDLLRVPGTRYLILDFARVDGVDAAGLSNLTRLRSLSGDAAVTLILSALSPSILSQLEAMVGPLRNQNAAADSGFLILPDADQALQWCENRLLGISDTDAARPEGLVAMEELDQACVRALVADMADYLERGEFLADQILWHPGDVSLDMYYVESGELELFVQAANGLSKRLAVIGAGDMIGVNGLYLQQPRPAYMKTSAACVLHRLSRSAMERMAERSPDVLARLDRYLLINQTRLLVRTYQAVEIMM